MNSSKIDMPSDRKFGLFFSFIFICIFFYVKDPSSGVWLYSLLVLSLITFIFGIFFPGKLSFFNWLWFKLGLIIGKVVSPIVLGAIFFGIFTPIAVFMRILRRDELKLKISGNKSYWLERSPSELESDSFKNQY